MAHDPGGPGSWILAPCSCCFFIFSTAATRSPGRGPHLSIKSESISLDPLSRIDRIRHGRTRLLINAISPTTIKNLPHQRDLLYTTDHIPHIALCLYRVTWRFVDIDTPVTHNQAYCLPAVCKLLGIIKTIGTALVRRFGTDDDAPVRNVLPALPPFCRDGGKIASRNYCVTFVLPGTTVKSLKT